MTTIGIPYAFGEWTSEGIVKTCPVCGEKILEPTAEFDEYGESIHVTDDGLSKGTEPYQLHYAVNHAGQV
jgi:heterodisulfide reductase subunit B